MFRSILVCGCLLAVHAISVSASVIYDFNSPAYTVGGISGQDGWTAGVGASVVNVAGSDNALLVSANDSASNTLAGSGFGSITSLSYLAAVSSGSAYAEIQLVDSNSTLYAHWGFQNSPDAFYYYDDGGFNSTSSAVAADNVYSVEVTFDFVAQQYRVTFTDTVDSSVDFDSGFVNLIAGTTAVLAEAGDINLYGGVEGQSAFYDDISVTAIPEPSGLLLGMIGLIGLFRLVPRKRIRA